MVGLLQFADVTAVRFAEDVHVVAVAIDAGDLFFEAVDGSLIIAALQIIAALLEGGLHGKLRAQPALRIVAASRADGERQRKQQADAEEKQQAIPDHESILAWGLEGFRARALRRGSIRAAGAGR